MLHLSYRCNSHLVSPVRRRNRASRRLFPRYLCSACIPTSFGLVLKRSRRSAPYLPPIHRGTCSAPMYRGELQPLVGRERRCLFIHVDCGLGFRQHLSLYIQSIAETLFSKDSPVPSPQGLTQLANMPPYQENI